MPTILLIDDDKTFSEPLAFYINEMGCECEVADSFFQGEALAREKDYDIVLLDVFLPDMSGLDGISRIKSMPSSPEIIIITGHGDVQGAEIALKNGAWDYLEKPVSYSRIKLLLGRAAEYRKQKRKACEQRILRRDAIVGNSKKIMECLEIVAMAANSSESVFIWGETGTGKESMAKAVHLNSPRKDFPFVTVDCTNIPANLVEALLFGHAKGTFTGADKDREGLIRQANRGTLFFDEVGDLPMPAQKALLGVLQKKRFRPLGAKEEIACDFRIVSATNRDLKEMMAQGRFRRDLYYRLVSFSIHLPPLRERLDDIKLLVNYYVNQICEATGINTKGISKDFMEYLTQYDWPGNIRELVNTLHTSVAHATDEPVLYAQHLPLDMRLAVMKNTLQETKREKNEAQRIVLELNAASFPSLGIFRDMAESKYLDRLIPFAGGKVEAACAIAGISRSGWYHLLEKHGKKSRKHNDQPIPH